MELEKRNRCGNISEEQKAILYKYMEENPDLRQAKFSNTFTHKIAQQKWEEIAGELHQTVGVIKDWKAWRKTWQDLCSRAKQKKSRIKNSQNATGGGPRTVEMLTPFEQKIVQLIGSTAIEGHAEVLESEVINFLDTTASTSSNNPTNQPAILNELISVECYVDESNLTRHKTSPFAVINQLETNIIESANRDSPKPVSCNSVLGKRKNINKDSTPRKKPTLSNKKLEHTLQTQEKISEQLEQKNRIKENYYKRKLELYERLIIAKEEHYKRCNKECKKY